MTALIDRYVHAALRVAPSGQRPELEREIRALVADTIEARDGDERAALAELGDPAELAARYTHGPQHLIGPRLFGEWRRILTLILPIVVSLAAAVIAGANLLGGSTIGEAITAAIGVAITAAIQTVFWVTVVFAVIERTTASGATASGATASGAAARGRVWTPDQLPELPDDGRISATDVVTDLVADVVLLAALVWVSLAQPVVIDGASYSLLDPALWSFWLPWLLVVAVLSVVLTVARFVHGRWTHGFAVANAALNASFAIPGLYLLLNGMLFDAALVEKVTAVTGDAWLRPTVAITAVVIAAIVTWDTIEGFLKARRASRGR